MRASIAGTVLLAAVAALLGCSPRTSGPGPTDFKVGECLRLSGTADHPQANKAACGSPASNFKVIAVATNGGTGRATCPADVDSSYSLHNAVSGFDNTLCLDIDWSIGGCMSVDPGHTKDPVRVDCADASAPHRQRATQILKDLDPPVSVDQCGSGLGYAYNERRFAVCVENVGG